MGNIGNKKVPLLAIKRNLIIITMTKKILIVDDEPEMCISLHKLFKAHGIASDFCTNGHSAQELLNKNEYGLLISDLKMEGFTGIDLLKYINRLAAPLPTIIISGYATTEVVVQAMRLGAINFYEKPVPFAPLLNEVSRLLEIQSTPPILNEDIDEEALFITKNPRMKEIIAIAKKAALTDAPIVVTGESGTGKEILSTLIHQSSLRRDGPLIKLNCAALPEALLESELFGYDKGAFTGAQENHKGKFEVAEGGTLLFDEISDMSLRTQAKLLRVIQEKEYERLGSNEIRRCDVRFLAATNRNLEEAIEKGHFREDLYFRFSVINIEIPPLRQRLEDIHPLCTYFITHFNQKYDKNIKKISDETRKIFLTHSWPGNVRELKNCLERAVIFCEGDIIETTNLPLQYQQTSTSKSTTDPIKQLHDNVSREMIIDALNKAEGNKTRAAEMLRISRKTLYLRMNKLGIDL